MKSKNTYETLLISAYGIFLTYSLIGHISVFHEPLKYLTFFAIALLLLNAFYQFRIVQKDIFIQFSFLLVLSLVLAYTNKDFGFFKLVLFAGSARRVNFKNVVKFDLYLRSCLILIVVALYYVGIAPDVYFTFNGIWRHSMGFTNPNALGIAIFVLVCDIYYVFGMKMRFPKLLVVLGIVGWLYGVARCRTAVLAICILTIISIVYSIIPRFIEKKLVQIGFTLIPLVSAALTMIGTNAYLERKPWAFELNVLLSNRLGTVSSFAEVFSPKILGQPIGETLSRSLDNTYGFVLYDLGIVAFVLFLVVITFIIRNSFNREDYALGFIMMVFAFYGLSEHLWINVDYNIFMLTFCYCISKSFNIIDNDEAEYNIIRESQEKM